MAAKIENKVIVCKSADEQSQIDLMQSFYWELLSTQTVYAVDHTIERRGENFYDVKTTTNFIKLAFKRSRDIPHYDQIKKLESEYSLLPLPKWPKLFPGHWSLWAAGFLFTVGFFIPVWLVYLFLVYGTKWRKAKRDYEQLVISRKEIMERLDYLENVPDDKQEAQQQIKPQLKIA